MARIRFWAPFPRVGGQGSRKRRSVAANPRGEEKSPAQSRGTAPARVAAIAALAIVLIALAAILLGGDSGHRYNLVFQNASQLVPDNQVLIGGQPVGSVESIELTDDSLAEVKISIEQELHEGSTAIVRATSLSGVANHYVSIEPGPNDNPPLDDGATLGLSETTTPADLDQLFNSFSPRTRKGLSDFIQGQAAFYSGRGEDGNEASKYFGPSLNRVNAFVGELNADQRLLKDFVVNSGKLATAVAQRGGNLENAISNATTAFDAIARQNTAFSQTLRRLPPVFRQSNTTFVNLRAALDDLDPLVETAKPATKDLAPFLAELRPVIQKAVPLFKNLRLTVRRPGKANDAAELLATLPAVQQRAARAFPHAEEAIEDFQPNLNFARAYTPDIFNGFAKLGQITGYYDANGHYARISFADLNIFNYNAGELKPIPPSQQYETLASGETVKRPCPGAATQPHPDGSNPFVEPPHTGSGVTADECNPADVPPGP
jgi:phospholipid/cholesterol/gamma-HCH transport system substrate-binding protein